MLPFAHDTFLDHSGGFGDAATEDQVGSPERLMTG